MGVIIPNVSTVMYACFKSESQEFNYNCKIIYIAHFYLCKQFKQICFLAAELH